jgi:hypothetical protein
MAAASSIGLDALVEVHNEAEMQRAVAQASSSASTIAICAPDIDLADEHLPLAPPVQPWSQRRHLHARRHAAWSCRCERCSSAEVS